MAGHKKKDEEPMSASRVTDEEEVPGSEEPGETPEEASERAGSGEGGSEEDLQVELSQLQAEMEDLKDQHLRLAAEFENYRKRVTGELASRWDRAQAELVGRLVEGLDDLRRVSEYTSEDASLESLIEGVDLVERKILKALNDAGMEIVDPEGEAFDPAVMEAMMRVPAEEEGQDDTVHQVLQKGYLFKDLLVRPARVSVFKDDD